MKNAHPALTKTKLDSPRANHAQAIRTALPVPPVAHSMPPVVQPVPTPVVLQHAIHVTLVNTVLLVHLDHQVASTMSAIVQMLWV